MALSSGIYACSTIFPHYENTSNFTLAYHKILNYISHFHYKYWPNVCYKKIEHVITDVESAKNITLTIPRLQYESNIQ